jgi:hypothetical protein
VTPDDSQVSTWPAGALNKPAPFSKHATTHDIPAVNCDKDSGIYDYVGGCWHSENCTACIFMAHVMKMEAATSNETAVPTNQINIFRCDSLASRSIALPKKLTDPQVIKKLPHYRAPNGPISREIKADYAANAINCHFNIIFHTRLESINGQIS